MKKFTTCLWFDGQAEEAAKFYTSIFKSSKIGAVSRYSEEAAKASGRPKGSAMVATFTLEGHQFMGLNGGPMYKFTPAFSLMVSCKNQKELDYFWDKLSAGGKILECGWLTDKFGLSWQIIPARLNKWISGKDPKRTGGVMQALLQMKKLDIKTLQQAYER